MLKWSYFNFSRLFVGYLTSKDASVPAQTQGVQQDNVVVERKGTETSVLSMRAKSKILMRHLWINQKTEYLFGSDFQILYADGKQLLELQEQMATLLDKIEKYSVPEEGQKTAIGFQPKNLNL